MTQHSASQIASIKVTPVAGAPMWMVLVRYVDGMHTNKWARSKKGADAIVTRFLADEAPSSIGSGVN